MAPELAGTLADAWELYFGNARLGPRARELLARAAGLGRDRAACHWAELTGAERLAVLECVPALLALAECLSRELARPADGPARVPRAALGLAPR